MSGGAAPTLFPVEAVEQQLRECIAWPQAPASLVSAAEYALLGGGKRLRPALAWHCAVAVGGTGGASLLAGAAVEMIHAFSLVHDDLPAIDNDDMRRGRPTLHRHAGEAMAVLAGDALMASAFECLLTMPLHPTCGAAGTLLRAGLLGELVVATGAMIRGQVWDTMGGLPGGLSATERLRLIHSNKTGALLRASCRMGAMSVLGPGADLTPIDTYGGAIGLMFQVVDDLIDATQTGEHAGKRTGKDVEAGKQTYPGVLGVEATRVEIERLRTEALSAVEPLGAAAEGLRVLCEYLAKRTK